MRDWLIKDFGWKLFSLLLAVFIWFTVHKIIEEPKLATTSPASTQIQIEKIPVFIVAAAADRHQFQLNSNTVSVTVIGPPAIMDTLKRNQIRATVDLSDFNKETANTSRPVDVSVPWGVTVVEVAPSDVQIIPPSLP